MFRKYAFCEILRGEFSFYANKIHNMYKMSLIMGLNIRFITIYG